MADAVLQRSCWEAMDLSQLPSDVGKTLDRSWGFSRFLCQMKQEKEKLETSARAVLELALPWARGMGRSWAGGEWSSIGAWCPERLEDARRRQSCQNGAFYFATEVGCMEKWNILAEPIPKLQMLKLLET